MTRVDNLFTHTDGGFYCLLNDDAALKEPTPVGVWHDGVIYMGADGKMRSTTKARWLDRFTPVAEYTGDDESVLSMIRRCNPGDRDLDFISVMESWHESEMGVTGHMLELAVAATAERLAAEMNWRIEDRLDMKEGLALTIMTADLQRVAQQYRIERVPIPHGFVFVMRK